MVRSFNKKRYILAGALTIMIFLLGLMFGFVIESKRVSYIRDEGAKQELEYQSLQLQYLFIDQSGEDKNCYAVMRTFDESVTNLEEVRRRLEEYNQESAVNKKQFEVLRREYTLEQIRYWLLARKTKKLCNTEISTILYFFAPDEMCGRCNEQAFVLTYLKKILGDKLLNFAILAEQEEPMVNILKATYNITQYPTMIIEDKKFEGFTTKNAILKEVCRQYPSGAEACFPDSSGLLEIPK